MDSTTYFYGTGINTNSYKDFGLLRTAPTEISSPVVKKQIVDNPGGNGNIDLTDSLTGVPLYENRQIVEKYIMVGNKQSWDSRLSALYKLLDGQQGNILLDSDPGYFWHGRTLITAVDKSAETHMKITVTSDVEPFKYERFSSNAAWEWDSLNFDTGIIRDYRNIAVDGELIFEIIGTKMPAVPSFSPSNVTDPIQVRFEGKSFDLPADLTTEVDSIVIREGLNVLTFFGKGAVTINFRGGIL